jgi:hypothetical protein
MALFTDAGVISINDLLRYEGTLIQVASEHDINVNTKIALATSAISDRLMLWLLNIGASDPQFVSRRSIGLSTVVMTEPLRRWLVFESLTRIYAEAFNRQLNTRFQGKMQEYQNEVKAAADYAFQSGIGVVFNPLSEPAMPLVSVQSGSAAAIGLFVQTTWVDAKGSESSPSPVNGLILNDQSGITVAMAEGVVGAPAAAAGWHVYIGIDQNTPTRQTAISQQIGSTWQLPLSGIVSGSAVGTGRMPNFFIRTSKQILRG